LKIDMRKIRSVKIVSAKTKKTETMEPVSPEMTLLFAEAVKKFADLTKQPRVLNKVEGVT